MKKHAGRNDKPQSRKPLAAASPDPKLGRGAMPNSGEHVIYGTLPILEALRKRPERVVTVMIAEGVRERRIEELVELARHGNVSVKVVPKGVLAQVIGEEVNHQGVAAISTTVEFVDIDGLLGGISGPALLVILDGIEDPRNLGAVIRTAECAGADGVVIPERRAVGLTGTVSKSAAGATEFVKISQVANINRLIEKLKKNSIWVVGTAGEADMSYEAWDWTQPSAVILGSEGSGMHRLVRENCDVLVKIPMYGKIESLNVSVAAGVILFEANRQRGQSEE